MTTVSCNPTEILEKVLEERASKTLRENLNVMAHELREKYGDRAEEFMADRLCVLFQHWDGELSNIADVFNERVIEFVDWKRIVEWIMKGKQNGPAVKANRSD